MSDVVAAADDDDLMMMMTARSAPRSSLGSSLVGSLEGFEWFGGGGGSLHFS